MDEKEFIEKMRKFLEAVEDGSHESLQRNKELLKEIATYCKDRRLFKRTEQETREFAKRMTALECYIHMIEKITGAPGGSIGAEMVAIMFMPIIDEKLNEKVIGSDNTTHLTTDINPYRRQ